MQCATEMAGISAENKPRSMSYYTRELGADASKLCAIILSWGSIHIQGHIRAYQNHKTSRPRNKLPSSKMTCQVEVK